MGSNLGLSVVPPHSNIQGEGLYGSPTKDINPAGDSYWAGQQLNFIPHVFPIFAALGGDSDEVKWEMGDNFFLGVVGVGLALGQRENCTYYRRGGWVRKSLYVLGIHVRHHEPQHGGGTSIITMTFSSSSSSTSAAT